MDFCLGEIPSEQNVSIGLQASTWIKETTIFHENTPISFFLLICCRWFDFLVLGLIIMNVFFLALDDPLTGEGNLPTDRLQIILMYTDIVLTVIFLLEMVIKWIAMGLWFDKNTYFRNGWNVLDFIINVIRY